MKDWLELVEPVPVVDYHLFIDCAYTSTKANDVTAIMVAGALGNIVYVEKICELWLEFPELIKKIIEFTNTDTTANCKICTEPQASDRALPSKLKKLC